MLLSQHTFLQYQQVIVLIFLVKEKQD